MPKPGNDETKDQFIERCIPIVIEDGTAKDGKQAFAVCNSLWEQKDHEVTKIDTIYLLDTYATVTPGDPYRLFPFGKIIKDGNEIVLTPELAAKFKLPHFKPPIKRGSHREDAPAGGFIVGLEVRADGLYAIPEWNEPGLKIVSDGDYRYHSPEVVWDDGPVFEDPKTGDYIYGPMIVGDALLHMPHLGEAAALYSVEPLDDVQEEEVGEEADLQKDMEVLMVEQTRWEKFVSWFEKEVEKPEPQIEPENVVEVEIYEAAVKERDAYKAELDKMAAEARQVDRVDHFKAELTETKVNADELAELMANLPDEAAERILQEFKALSAQINDSALTKEIGTDGGGLPDNPAERLDAMIKGKAMEAGVGYSAALEMVRKEQPDLVAAIYG